MAETLALPPESKTDARVRFRASDVARMIEIGLLSTANDEKYEVLDGEIVPMMAPNTPHMRVTRYLSSELTLQLGRDYWVVAEHRFSLIEDDGDYALPDILIYPRDLSPEQVRGPDALLVIEVAHSSLKKDRELKAALYAQAGVREYWVIDAAKLVTWRFANPVDGAYPSPERFPSTSPLTPRLLPALSLRLSDLG